MRAAFARWLCGLGLLTCVGAGEASAREGVRGQLPPLAGVLNVNAASEDQLGMLPGIGPARAEAILARRQRRPFRSPHELRTIKGIGPKTYARIRTFLAIDGKTTLRRLETPEPTEEQPPLTP